MEHIHGMEQLAEANEKLFASIWKWFVDNRITDKEAPQVASDPVGSYHHDGLIAIKESHDDKNFPLGAVMLEEIVHYVTSSTNEQSSADYSPEFLAFILRLIRNNVTKPEDRLPAKKRDGCDPQSVLINCLWKLIEREIKVAKTA